MAFLRSLDRGCVLLAALAGVALFFLSGVDPFWSDWGLQAAEPVNALARGDLQDFVDGVSPTYVGTLLLRSPIFLSVYALGGGEDQAYFACKAVALVLLSGLGAWLLTLARRRGAEWATLLLVAFLTAGSPIAAKALDYGHPEDVMAAVLAIAGVLAAGRGRGLAAGLLVGLAIVLKQWAVLALLPALAAAPGGRLRLLAPALALPALFLLPLLFRESASVADGVSAATLDVWRSHQLWWPLGVENTNPKPLGPRIGPEWFSPFPRMVIVGLSLPLSLLWWRHRRAGRGHRDDILLLLALLLLGRCALEPWNIDYYHLPFLLTLATWEVVRGRGLPVLTLLATCAVWFSFHTWPWFYGDQTYLMYMGWAGLLAWYLTRTLLGTEPQLQALRRISTSAKPSVSLPPDPA